MKKTTSFIIFLLFVLNSILSLYAVKAYPYPIVVKQADGTELTIQLKGDEFFKFKTTVDGYLLVENDKGILTYAEADYTGRFKSTKVKATDIKKRSIKEKQFVQGLKQNIDFSRIQKTRRAIWQSSPDRVSTSNTAGFPLSGSPKSLAILVNFSDVNFTVPNPKTSFTDLLNKQNYSDNLATGSARDYFRDVSMGVFNPEFDVVGPFTLPQNMAYYGANDAGGNDANPRQMVIDACTLASTNGVDFSQYDSDHNGSVDNVFIYYAGYNEAEGASTNTIWPHRWTLANHYTVFNGVSVFDYACTSELRSRTGSNMCGIGTFCHEFGHVLGLVDYYATDGSTHQTLSYWNIMDAGPYLNLGRTPPTYSAWDRFFLGWLTPIEIKDPAEYSLDNLSTSNNAYLITQYGNSNLIGSNPNPSEFFTLENRQNVGWDTYLPGHGMLVTHVYYNLSTWLANTPNNNPLAMGVDIVEADGIASDNNLAGDPFPGSNNIQSYTPILRDGTDIRKPLKNIKEVNGKITFDFGSNIFINGTFNPFYTTQGTPSIVQTVSVSAIKLTQNLTISFAIGTHFEIKKQTDPDSSWGKSHTLTQANGLVAQTNLDVRYNPTVPSYTTTHTETLKFISGTNIAELLLTGASNRKVSVVSPVANDPSDVTFSGFVANWSSVFDATGYYLTIYNLAEGESTLFEGFDNGLTPPTSWKITASAISTSAIYSGTSTPSIQFSSIGEYVLTEKYQIPVSSLSFYIRSMGATNGGFIVEALNSQNVWEKVDSIPVTSILNEKSKSYTFDATKSYIQFKFRYFKGLGSVTFDDVKVSFSKKIEYVFRDKWVTTTSETISDLKPFTDYVYNVRASDKNTLYKYENITDVSNSVSLQTLPYPLEKDLLAIPDANGNVKVYLPTTDVILYVYNLEGKCVKTIVPTSATVTITDLTRQQMYILEADGRKAKITI